MTTQFHVRMLVFQLNKHIKYQPTWTFNFNTGWE